MSTASHRSAPRADDTAAPVARHGRLRSGHPVGFVARVVAATLAVVLVSTASVAAFAVYNLTSAVGPGVSLAGEDDDPVQIGAIEGGVNLLLVGSDSGGGNAAYGERDAELNDVTMLMHISEDHERATVVSFPRDLFVDIPECTGPDGTVYNPAYSAKINSALSRGGLACVVLTVEALTGLDIPYAAEIEFDGVIAMSNAVGGVPVCVATPIDDRQISFQLDAGEHSLSGFDALQFLRSRYGVGDGSDTTRISNQQQFLSSLVRTLKSSDTLSNPVRLYGIATAATQNLQLSNSLQSVDTMVSIASALRDIPLEEVVFVRYPSGSGTSNGQSGVVAIETAASELIAAIEADLPLTLTGDTGGGTIDPDALDENGVPVEPEVPEVPEETPGETPAPSADPSAPTTPAPSEGTADGETPRVDLPDTVEGQTADQETCTAGQTAGG
ncbi:LCP family protein [Marisediminicola sp. LYQ134]|uniref:LCP family protein n=1 Tax=Marisediminicola sp. LYQ134 TaxID=3391061 RepID=UPI0039835A52